MMGLLVIPGGGTNARINRDGDEPMTLVYATTDTVDDAVTTLKIYGARAGDKVVIRRGTFGKPTEETELTL